LSTIPQAQEKGWWRYATGLFLLEALVCIPETVELFHTQACELFQHLLIDYEEL